MGEPLTGALPVHLSILRHRDRTLNVNESPYFIQVSIPGSTSPDINCHIRQEEVIACGDESNDYSMIKYAGLGVAMGNAIDKVKAAANYITDTNDNDGVAKVIEKFILK